MLQLDVRLFGEFEYFISGCPAGKIQSRRAQELFAYLLLNRHRALSRDVIMGALWLEGPAEQCRKHLRHSLWKLQECAKLILGLDTETPLLISSADTLRVNPQINMLVDVAEFEEASFGLRVAPQTAPAGDPISRLRKAVDLYRGDLLDGWYSEWCLVERERLQNVYLAMLDRLIAHCRHADDRPGVHDFANRMLRQDHAHERAHQALIWLELAEGNHAGAMRQFQRCREILKDELDVPPSDETLALAHRISSTPTSMRTGPHAQTQLGAANPQEVLRSLKKLQAAAIRLNTRIQRQLNELERAIGS